ncbi:MAG: ATP-binding cassette domain-containing protein [Flavobacteriia bacterium]|nr:ATP-binding cassette domain-containing protein [Flavobacteriia bacterium]
MIELQDVCYSIGKKSILNSVSWKVYPGKLNLIVGPNGAGKSTVIKLLAEDVRPSSGAVLWDGKPIHQHKTPECYRGVLSQQHNLQFPLTVKEVVELGRYPHQKQRSTQNSKKIIEESLMRFELLELANRNIQTLSGGEQQRVHFARVWVQMAEPITGSTKLLLVDEPTTYLDIHHQWKYMEWIAEQTKANGWVTIGVLHDLPMVHQLADEVLLLNQGMKQLEGPSDAVLNAETLREYFQVNAKAEGGGLNVIGVSERQP